MRNYAASVLASFSILLVACPKPTAVADDAGASVPDAGVAPAVGAAAPPSVDAGTAVTATATAAHPHVAPTTIAAVKAMTPPTPTTDRFSRNRDKDGPCPAGFQEEPGAEEHSTCARLCKTEKDCHGHTCEDAMTAGKVCSETASGKAAPKAAAHTCKPGEIDDGESCFKPCTADKDCPKPMKCQSMMVGNPNGGTSTAMACQKP